LPTQPVANKTSTPLNPGTIGFLYSDADKDELIPLFNPVDERENDAVAHEVQDSNNGHPEGRNGTYHFHSLPEAMRNSEGVIGYARDGFEIRGSVENGKKITNSDLDANHGKFTTNAQGQRTYAYYATDEYPYVIGAYKGTPGMVTGEGPAGPPPLPPGPPPGAGLSGQNTFTGDAANNTFSGGAGKDRLSGGGGADSLFGNAGADRLVGGAGNDKLAGGTGADVLKGGTRADKITGGAGNDKINAGQGADKIIAGAGNDKVNGGKGNDTAVLKGNRADYQVTQTGNNRFEVRDKSGNVDTFTNVETLKFADGKMKLK
jgi:Ca2+-binding RTX toxin-like protein